MNRKLKIIVLSVTMSLMFSVTAFADTISGVDLLNNTQKSSQYKLSQSEANKVIKNTNVTSQIKEVFDKDNGVSLTDTTSQYSWLVNHDIITSESDIDASSQGVSITQGNNEDSSNDINTANFYMEAYKAVYGVIPSREVIFNVPSYRMINGQRTLMTTTTNYTPNNYSGNATSFNFASGDKDIYISPNVQELYLSSLLEKGYLQPSQFKNREFIKQYEENGKTVGGHIQYAAWSNKLPAYTPIIGQAQGNYSIVGGSPLGSCWKINGYKSGYNMPIKYFHAQRTLPEFFMHNTISTMDALNFIAKMMREQDGNMSQKEADMIMYKYGTGYILRFPDNERNTLSYLIAMGVINFDQPITYAELNQTLTQSEANNLLYKVANKKGRINFKQIKLTDTETQLMKQGFVQQPVTLVTKGNPVNQETLSVSKTDKISDYSIPEKVLQSLGLIKINRQAIYGGSGNTTYTVTKQFQNPSDVVYDGVKITNLHTVLGNNDGYKVIKDGKGEPWVVSFQVSAPSPQQALLNINARLHSIGTTDQTSTIQAITKIATTENGQKKSVIYINQNELESLNSPIEVLNDKTLKNKATGARALFLTDKNEALIGNEIVTSPVPMVQKIGSEVYYNFTLVASLLPNASISSLDPYKIFLPTNDYDVKPGYSLVNTSLTPVLGNGCQISAVPTVHQSAFGFKETSANDPLYYEENLLTTGISALNKNYWIMLNGKETEVTVVVNWGYSVPKVVNWDNNINKNFTINGATAWLTTPPQGGDALDWWNQNIGLSNAIANKMYATQDIQYIRSGYLSPSVSILVDGSGDPKQAANKIFGNMDFNSSYVQNYLSGSASNWMQLFNESSGSGKGRQLQLMGGTRQVKNGIAYYQFGNSYVVTQYGAIFRNVLTDNRLTYNSNGDLVVNTRTKGSVLGDGSRIVYYGGNPFFMNGSTSDGKYFRITSLKPISGLASTKGNENFIGGESSENSEMDMSNSSTATPLGYLTEYTQKLASIFPANTTAPLSSYNSYGRYALIPDNILPNSDKYKSGDLLVYKNKFHTVSGNPGSYSYSTAYPNSETTVTGYPNIYISSAYYSFKGNQIVKASLNPYERAGNIYYSGINNTLISSIIAQNSGSIPFSKLPKGANVLIQDVDYTKTANYLVSQPIEDSTLVGGIENELGSTRKGIATEILKIFTGDTVMVGGLTEPVADFVSTTDGSSGNPVINAGIGNLLDKSKANNTIYSDGANTMYLGSSSGTASAFNNSDPAKSVCIQVQFNDDLLFTPINKKSNDYILSSIAKGVPNGYVGNCPFFAEKLEYSTINPMMFLGQSKQLFKDFPGFSKFKADWDNFSMKASLNSCVTWVYIGLISICMWILVFSSVGYMYVKNRLGSELVLRFMNLSEQAFGIKIDLYRIVSCFIYGYDDYDAPLYKHFIFSIGLVFIISLITYYGLGVR